MEADVGMQPPLSVGLLDFSISFDATMSCARLADSLGYSRYWLTEHHAAMDPWASPEIVLTMLAMATKRLSLGSGGTLLRFHRLLETACDFKLLSSLFPGRIDLGLARGAPGLQAHQKALYDDRLVDFGERAQQLINMLQQPSVGVDLSETRALPLTDAAPTVWVLGSSSNAAKLALRLGARYCHGMFFKRDESMLNCIIAPERSIIAIAGICGHDQAESRQMAIEARPGITPSVIGTAEQCVDVMADLARQTGVKEIVFADLSITKEHRLRTVIQLASELSKRSSSQAPIAEVRLL